MSISLSRQIEHPRFAMVVPVSARRFTAHMHVEEISHVDDQLLDLIAPPDAGDE